LLSSNKIVFFAKKTSEMIKIIIMELNLTKYRNLGTKSILKREERRINGQIIIIIIIIIIWNTQVISATSQNYTSLEIIFQNVRILKR
jgi:hypothetical protein